MHIFHKWRLVKISSFKKSYPQGGNSFLVGGRGYECDVCGKKKSVMEYDAPSFCEEEMMQWVNET